MRNLKKRYYHIMSIFIVISLILTFMFDWSGHKIKCDYGTGTIDYNRSCSLDTDIIMIDRHASNRTRNSQCILMHELNHQYGAPDHYHEILSDRTCRGGAICSECGINPRPKSCIMYDNYQSIFSSSILCSGCRSQMIAHLNGHH